MVGWVSSRAQRGICFSELRSATLILKYLIAMVRNSLLITSIAIVFALAGFAAHLMRAQEPVIRTRVEQVSLFVSARDGQGQPVNDLAREEFRVFEDGRAQTVDYFARATSMPLSLGLLLDTSGSQRNLLPAEQAAAIRFLERTLRSGDEAMVVTFDLQVALPEGFTSDRAVLERAIQRARIRMPEEAKTESGATPAGTTLYDAIYETCSKRLAGRAGRKALVIITDAEDTGSRISREEALDIAQRTDTILHIILITQRAGFGFGRENERNARKLAEETGGRVVTASYAADLDAAFDQLEEELRSQYILGYTPSNRARDGAWRKVKVETARRRTRAFTRSGYFAPRN